MTSPSTAVLVVNFRSAALLQQNLVPLSRQGDYTVVITDNFSSAAERDTMRALAEREGWLLVLPEDNLGFGEGMNRAAAVARDHGARRLLLLNPDASISPQAVEVLAERVQREPDALVAPVIRRSDGTIWFDGADLYLEDGRTRSARRRREGPTAPWLTGACIMIDVALWERIGGFDPAYFLYWEDVDLSWRVLQAGGSLVVETHAEAVHDAGGTLSDTERLGSVRAKSSPYYYFNIRNRLLFAALRLEGAERRAWLRHTPAVTMEILLRGGRRQFARPWRPVAAAARGVVDGLALARSARAGTPLRVPAVEARLRSGRVG